MFNQFSFFKSLRATKSKPIEKFRQLSADLDFDAANWLALSINSAQSPCLFNRSIELKGPQMDFAFELGPKNNQKIEKDISSGPYYVRWHMPNKHSFMGHLNQGHSEVFYNNNLLIDEALELFIKKLQDKIGRPRQDIPTQDLPTALGKEQKAQEWLRVSFKVLKEAMAKAKKDPYLLLQARLWMGQDPEASHQEGKSSDQEKTILRLICFNLDIIAQINPKGALWVQVYDDESGPTGSSQRPKLDALFELRQRETFDQFIDLLSTLGTCAKWPIPLKRLETPTLDH